MGGGSLKLKYILNFNITCGISCRQVKQGVWGAAARRIPEIDAAVGMSLIKNGYIYIYCIYIYIYIY